MRVTRTVARRSVREVLALILIGVAAATQVPDGAWNGAAHFALVQSLADGTPIIDRHLNQSGDISYIDGHYYTAKAPGLALFSLPSYLIADTLGQIPRGEPTPPPPSRYASGRTMWNVNLTVVAAFVVLLLVVRASVNRFSTAGTAVAIVLGLGTLLLPLATSYFAHDLAALLAFAAFAVTFRERAVRSPAAVVAAGILAGLAVTVEFPAAIVAAGVAAYVVADRPRIRRGAYYAAGLAAGVAPLLAFDVWAFGSPFRTSYAHAVIDRGTSGHDVLGANDAGFFGVTHPRLHALVDILLSERGLFVLTPVTLAALAGLVPLARRGLRREALVVAGLTVAMVLYNASYYMPFGGYTPGPRFLILLLPFLALPLAEAWTRWRKVTVLAAGLSVFWTVAATLAQPLLPTAEHPTLWLSRLVRGKELTGSVFGGGWLGIAVFAVPALAAVALALSGAIIDRYEQWHRGAAIART